MKVLRLFLATIIEKMIVLCERFIVLLLIIRVMW